MIKNALLTILFATFTFLGELFAQNESVLKVYFKTDSFNLPFEEQTKFVNFVKSFDTVIVDTISIIAYCDDIGKKDYNDTLSLRRANCMRDTWNRLNFQQKKEMTSIGKGELPVLNLSNKNIEEQRSHNRRAEIMVEYRIKEIKKDTVSVNTSRIILGDNLRKGDRITLNNILFEGGRHILLPESYPSLENLIYTLQIKKGYNIIILGHVCCMQFEGDGLDFDTGTYNLSVTRAKTIYYYLIDNGVDANRLSYKGMKADYPTGKGEKFDRRVEIEISDIINK